MRNRRRLIDLDKINLQRVAEKVELGEEQIQMVLATAELEMKNRKAPPGGISIMDASRKYEVNQQTISTWVKKGYIPVLARTAYQTFIDEATLAHIVKLYKRAPGPGKWTLKKALTNQQGCASRSSRAPAS